MQLENADKTDLQAELEKAEAALEDVREERRFTLGQTGIHLGGRKVAALNAEWAGEEKMWIERIAVIRRLMQGETQATGDNRSER